MSSAAGLALGYAADAVLGDPRRGHPVAMFGRGASALERAMWRPSRARGTAYAVACIGAATATGALLGRLPRRRWSRIAVTAVAGWAVLGGRSLHREAGRIGDALEAGDLDAARAALPALVGRDPSTLDGDDIARAVVESVAENTSDAVVAPLLWGAVAGPAGLFGYRAVNTLDAMVGYRSEHYEKFGWAAARIDDAANWVPARVTGALAAALAPVVDGDRGRAWRILCRDGGSHPSPNAGRCEAAFAGALDIRLGGRNVYGDRVEDRPELGDGSGPRARDIERAVRLSRAVGVTALVVACAVAALRDDRDMRG